MLKIITGIAVTAILFVVIHFFYVRSMAPKETYRDDDWLDTVSHKTALIIVAHDDDAISCSGTITKLCKAGWIVKELCFYNTVSGEEKNQLIKQRQEDIQQVKDIEGLAEFYPLNIPFRDIQESKIPEYMPVSGREFDKQYNRDTLLFYIRKFIQDNNPSVIFSLDNIIGGYGNPDHVIVSRLVLEECRQRASEISFPVEYIYQPVFTPSMVKNILAEMPVYRAALTTYGEGMPLPDVQVDITAAAAEKKDIMQAYKTEQNSIRKIWPFYQYYPAAIYFRLFNREFFRKIKLK